MQNNNRIPRWIVENDPSWEKSIDSDPGTLRWTKKGTNIQAVGHPASIFCEIVGQTDHSANISDLPGRIRIDKHASLMSGVDDITKYLSSRYLNPSMNRPPGFGIRKMPSD